MCWSCGKSSGIVVTYYGPPSTYDQWPSPSTERKKKQNLNQPCKEWLPSISIKPTKRTSKCKSCGLHSERSCSTSIMVIGCLLSV